MPREWITVRLRGWPVSRKRCSSALCSIVASTSPPPPPISATVSPSLMRATASAAVTNLEIGGISDHVGERASALLEHGPRDHGAVDFRGAVVDARDPCVAV